MKGYSRTFRSLISFGMAMLMLIGCLGGAMVAAADDDTSAHKLTSRYPLYQIVNEVEDPAPYYKYYLEDGKAAGWKDVASGTRVQVDLSTGKVTAYTDKDKTVAEGGDVLGLESDGSFIWDSDDVYTAEWTFTVEKDGYYCMEFVYTALQGSVSSPRRSVMIDGEIPYREISNIHFFRYWKDGGETWINGLGDEVRPKQEEIREKQTMLAVDALGRYLEPMKVYLTAGEHTISMGALQEDIQLHALSFTAPEYVKSYAEVLKQWKNAGYKPATQSIKINAEDAILKTAISLRRETSGDPLADPPSLENIVLNAIGGQGWNEGNQKIIWNLEVKESGLYKINLRAMQNYNDGLSSYRQILIDGQVPYQEWLCYEFPDMDWTTMTLEDANGNPYMIYLEAGKHTFEMSVKTAPYNDILLELETSVNNLSVIVQNIIKITGIEPDTGYDYDLEKKIPWLLDAFKEIVTSLDTQIGILSAMSEKKSSTVSSLEEVKYRLEKLIDDPFDIPSYLNTLIDYQTTLSAYISNFNNLALMLDYITVTPPEAEVENEQANFFQYIWYAIKQFFISFTKDYGAVSDNNNAAGEGAENILVWVSQGREWAETLKQICDEDFVRQKNINVTFNMLPAGSLGGAGVLLLSIASGTAPDVVVGTDSLTPTEYGMRDAVLDLSKFADYKEVESQFLPGAMTALRFNGATYALPETMDFSLMFYRTDILDSFGLQVPNTWDELYATILPELKRNGMDFWYEGGLYTFLYQQGGSLYNEDGTASAVDSEEAQKAFEQFADLYTVYDVPVSANFYNRFRSGQMPLGISSFATYLMLATAAPEIDGKWAVAPVPATVREDGTLDRSVMITTTCSMILNHTQETGKDAASWEFLKWYMSTDTQTRYANDLVAYIGSTVRWFSANVAAFDNLSWDTNLRTVVAEQRKWVQSNPNAIGGYITTRHLENARVRSVIEGMNYRESMEKAADDITREMQIKMEEFILRAEKANKK